MSIKIAWLHVLVVASKSQPYMVAYQSIVSEVSLLNELACEVKCNHLYEDYVSSSCLGTPHFPLVLAHIDRLVILQISRKWAHHITTLLFFGFGLWSLKDAIFEEG